MSGTHMPDLTELEIRNARPKDKSYKLSDGRGLVLLVNPDGSRYWRLRYHHQGREKLILASAPLPRLRRRSYCRRYVGSRPEGPLRLPTEPVPCAGVFSATPLPRGEPGATSVQT